MSKSQTLYREATAKAINEFLYKISLGYTPETAMELVVGVPVIGMAVREGTLLRMPSNLQIIVTKE